MLPASSLSEFLRASSAGVGYAPSMATRFVNVDPKTVKDPRLLVMQEKLQTEAGRKLYAKRKHTVEPVFGIIRSTVGLLWTDRGFLVGVCHVPARTENVDLWLGGRVWLII